MPPARSVRAREVPTLESSYLSHRKMNARDLTGPAIGFLHIVSHAGRALWSRTARLVLGTPRHNRVPLKKREPSGNLIRNSLCIKLFRINHEICSCLVAGPPLSEQPLQLNKGILLGQQRPQGALLPHSGKDGLRAGCEVDHGSRRAKHLYDPRNGNPAATGGQHHSAAGVAHLFREPLLERSKVGFPTVGKDAADRSALPPLDLLVEVDEWPRETRGEPPSDGGFAGAWKPD